MGASKTDREKQVEIEFLYLDLDVCTRRKGLMPIVKRHFSTKARPENRDERSFRHDAVERSPNLQVPSISATDFNADLAASALPPHASSRALSASTAHCEISTSLSATTPGVAEALFSLS